MKARRLGLGLALSIAVLGASGVRARPLNADLGGPLAGLALPHRGRAMHAGSFDRTGGNVDFRGLAPGQTLTLFDYKGTGVVHRFWLTFLPRASLGADPQAIIAAHRQAIIRMYWDNERTPSVEVPLGDFFGVGFGEQHDYQSLPLSETSGGYNCYWPMPFHHAARWTITNLGANAMLLWWNIDFTAQDKLPADLPHFHAQWRRENPTTAGQNYTILEASGHGHFAGTALFMQGLTGSGALALTFLEGDEMIYLDGERTPSIIGTGTEDYFNGGFYFDQGPFAALYHGAPIKDDAHVRVSAYRWHVEDAMPFRRSIRVTIEHGTNNTVAADYSSVAYFYQNEPHAPFPPLPTDPSGFLPSPPPVP
jgi:hypothetical protein